MDALRLRLECDVYKGDFVVFRLVEEYSEYVDSLKTKRKKVT